MIFKMQKSIQNKRPFVGTIVIKLHSATSIAILDFICNLFSGKTILFDTDGSSSKIAIYREITVYIVDYNMSDEESTADMVERCVVLNTYLSQIFFMMNIEQALVAFT